MLPHKSETSETHNYVMGQVLKRMACSTRMDCIYVVYMEAKYFVQTVLYICRWVIVFYEVCTYEFKKGIWLVQSKSFGKLHTIM